MRRKTQTIITHRDDVFIKYVKKARLWCKTHWNEKDEQVIEWFFDKELTQPVKK